MRLFITLIFIAAGLLPVHAQQNFWADADEKALPEAALRKSNYVVSNYRPLSLDLEGMKTALQAAPMEYTPEATAPILLDMPMPDGSTKAFEVVESPVMAPGLAARYPSIKTYKGWNPDDPRESIRFGYSPKGFHGTMLTARGAVYIDARTENANPVYMSYFVKDNPYPELWNTFECGTEHREEEVNTSAYEGNVIENRSPMGQITLRRYKLAIACTGEYAQFHGGTKEMALSAIVTKANRLNQVFERDLAVRMELVENNDQIIFLDPETDGYTNGNPGAMLGQNPGIINPIIGINGYHVGHVLGTNSGLGGVAILRGVCIPENKANASSTINQPVGDPFVIDIVAHEIGHQMGANHTMSTCHNINGGTAFEPGSGSTIMSYSGICGGNNNVQFNSDPYYHVGSLQEIFTHMRLGLGNACPEKILTGNTEPEVDIPLSNGFFIPLRTPFELTANATDAEGDALSYCWEQYDLGPLNTGLGTPQGDAPSFRSFPPNESPTRVFPKLEKILANNYDINEVLPTYGRNLTFRCTVRDNNPEGSAAVWAQVAFKADSTSGPFQVLSPNTFADRWTVGANTEVRWDVANTDNDLVNCQTVNIKLSLDGGFTYPITLLENTDNDGSAFITVPDVETTQARVRVEAAANIFFDVSNQNFTIETATEPGYALTLFPGEVNLCLPDPAIVEIQTASILGFDEPIELSLLGELPVGASYSFSQNQLNPSESATLTINFEGFFEETIDLRIQAVTESLDTAYRDLRIITASNDFSSMALLGPADGRDDIQLQTLFSWEGAADADFYDFQLATSATFNEASIIEDSYGLTGTEYYPESFFDNNLRFFWRVRPVNDCGPGPWLTPFVFQTVSVDCADSGAPNDLPVNLPSSSTTRTSTLFIPTDGLISDLNVNNVDIDINPVRNARITLVSPAGTRAILFDGNCFTNSGDIELNFDDEAPEDIPCPPDDFVPAQPEQPLSVFDGESTAGQWTLEVRVLQGGFGTGTLKNWTLEFCAATATTPPVLLTNEVLAVPPGQGNTITADYLAAQDDAAAPEQVTFTLLQPPANGTLYRWSLNEELATGSEFSQATINAFNLVYVHDGSDTQEDHFTFIVDDGQGGFIPTQTFNIVIDENAVVNTSEVQAGNAISLFPNPARDQVAISFREPVSGEIAVRLLNLQGQMARQQRFPEAGRQLEINTAGLPAGIYFVNVQTEEGAFTEKLILQR